MKGNRNTLRGIAYYRVSTDEQSETGRGLERQRRNVRGFYADNGIELVAEFSDDCSGTIDMGERPEGKQLYELLKHGGIDVVTCDTVCRATRPMYDEVEFIVLRYNLKKWFGVDLLCLDAPSTGDSFADNVIGLAKAKGAKEEREKIITRMTEGKYDKARAGNWVGGSPPPYGYRVVGKGREVRLEIEPGETEVVRRIYALYTGIGAARMPLQQIAATLTAESIHAPGRPGRGANGLGWYTRTLRAILKRTAYIGEFTFAGNVIRLPDLSIIDASVWEAAQVQLIINLKRSRRNRKREYLLSGHIQCVCDWSMTGYHSFNGRQEYLYYICGQRVGDKHLRRCRESYLRADISDRVVWDWLYNLLKNDAALDEGLDEMAAQRDDELEPKRREVDSLEELIAQAERKIVRLLSSFGDEEDETVAAALHAQVKELTSGKNAMIAKRNRFTMEIEQREVSDAVRAQIKRTVDKIRISGIIERGLYQDKRYLIDVLDLQAKIEYRNGQRGLYVTCGIEPDGEWLSIPGRTSSRTSPRTSCSSSCR